MINVTKVVSPHSTLNHFAIFQIKGLLHAQCLITCLEVFNKELQCLILTQSICQHSIQCLQDYKSALDILKRGSIHAFWTLKNFVLNSCPKRLSTIVLSSNLEQASSQLSGKRSLIPKFALSSSPINAGVSAPL